MDYPSLTAEELIEECTSAGKLDAWKEFVRRFQPLIAGVVVRTAQRYGKFGPALVDDLVQETYLRLCIAEWKRLREFQSHNQGTVYGFMKAVARTVTLDYFKAQYAGKRGAGVGNSPNLESALRTAALRDSLEDQVLVNEIDDRFAQIAETARDRRIFLLYYRQGFTTKAIAEIPGIGLSQKGVESCLQRLTRQLQREMAIPARRSSA
jgi:RNA polymerase sigma-70 factor (ECF subfamily)